VKLTANRQTIAKILSRSVTQVDNLVREGMPVQKPGRKGVEKGFSIPACVAWFVARACDGSDIGAERLRIARARAQRLENDLAKDSGKLIEADSVVRFLRNAFTVVKQRMIGLPSKVAVELAAITSPAAVQDALRDALYEALGSLDEGPESWEREMARLYAEQDLHSETEVPDDDAEDDERRQRRARGTRGGPGGRVPALEPAPRRGRDSRRERGAPTAPKGEGRRSDRASRQEGGDGAGEPPPGDGGSA